MKLSTLSTLLFIFLFILSSLSQENSSCQSNHVSSYNLNFHIIGVFIILCTSSLGIGLTMILGNYLHSTFMKMIIHMFKMFGIGIMAATAWIHLLPDAFSQFSNICLDSSWQTYGTAYVGLFGIIASFMVQIIEFTISSIGGLSHSHSHGIIPKKDTEAPDQYASSISTLTDEIDIVIHHDHSHAECQNLSLNYANLPKYEKLLCPSPDCKKHNAKNVENPINNAESEAANDHHPRDPALSVILLECGIIIHSFIIGLTLGTTGDNVYLSLMIAIIFHQVFEGMALGALISMLKIETPYYKTMMFFMYPIVTPLGNSLGIAIHQYYNENNSTTILVQGILGSISAGILFYNTYSELIVSEINHSKSFRNLSTLEKNLSFLCMYLGAACMAILAIWA